MSGFIIPYFAYGSNLCLRRLRSRVTGAQFVMQASLGGHILKWHKRSNDDGSGKCSIARQEGSLRMVHGAIFALPADQEKHLDQVEGVGYGYQKCLVEVETASGLKECMTYRAEDSHIDDSLLPFSWYRDLVVAGADAIGLDPAYVDLLRLVPASQDPDTDRDARERKFMPCGDFS